MIERQLEDLWGWLQAKKTQMPHFLSEVTLSGIRGIDGLRVAFEYPVSVIAGGNASGKSTVLVAAACAYKVPGAGVRDFVPSTLFPDYRARAGERRDDRGEVVMDFEYSTPEGRRSMRWRRLKSWNRSYFGRKRARQPQRPVYLRTLANLTNPSEVRGVLAMSHLKSPPRETALTPWESDFAQRMFPFRYSEVVKLSSNRKSLLFAVQESGGKYSELHMAAGERAILRLSQEIAHMHDGLVLIDEVEAGLHPWVQQLLMLQLQKLALQNNLQIVVTSHSSVVLNAVPPTGRIFLERNEDGTVSVVPAYRDLVQDALYGQSAHTLNVLCEDDAAEAILWGLFDHIVSRDRIHRESIKVGRDTGAGEFPGHARAFRKFGQIDNIVFVLDGDRRDAGDEKKILEAARQNVPILFLPGSSGPEQWVWDQLRARPHDASAEFGIDGNDLTKHMRRLGSVFDNTSGRPSEAAKYKMAQLAELLNRQTPDLCRGVALVEARRRESEVQPLMRDLADVVSRWRTGQ